MHAPPDHARPAAVTLDVGIDLDGVCYPFDRALAQWLHRTTGRPLHTMPTPDRWNVWEVWGLTRSQFADAIHAATEANFLFAWGAPLPGVVAGIARMRRAGHRIHVVTARGRLSRPDSAERTSRAWLAEHAICHDTFTLASDKTSVPVDAFIDDHHVNFEALRAAGIDAYLRDQPWNRHLRVDRHRRVPNFDAFVTAVETRAASLT